MFFSDAQKDDILHEIQDIMERHPEVAGELAPIVEKLAEILFAEKFPPGGVCGGV